MIHGRHPRQLYHWSSKQWLACCVRDEASVSVFRTYALKKAPKWGDFEERELRPFKILAPNICVLRIYAFTWEKDGSQAKFRTACLRLRRYIFLRKEV